MVTSKNTNESDFQIIGCSNLWISTLNFQLNKTTDCTDTQGLFYIAKAILIINIEKHEKYAVGKILFFQQSFNQRPIQTVGQESIQPYETCFHSWI